MGRTWCPFSTKFIFVCVPLRQQSCRTAIVVGPGSEDKTVTSVSGGSVLNKTPTYLPCVGVTVELKSGVRRF